MPTYTVRAPNGRTYKVSGPAGATQAQVEAAVLEAHPEARQPERKIGRGEAFARGVFQSAEKAATFFGGAIGDLVDKFGITPAQATAWAAENLSGKSPAEARRIAQNLQSLPGFGDIVRAGGKARDIQAAPAQRQRPNMFGAGRLTGDVGIIASLPVARALAPVVRVAPKLAPVARSIATGGLATGIKATTPILRAVDAALRVSAGAATGAGTSAILGQAVDEGAADGAAVSMIPLVGRYGAGPVYDALKGRVGVERASRIFREALGANVDAARAAFSKGGAAGKQTASQVLASIGINADTFFATGELVAKSGSSAGVLDDIARGQKVARETAMDAAAGGTSRTASRDAAATQRAVTTANAVPIMEETLGAANTGTRNVMAAQRTATTGRQTAATETATAKRLLGAADEQAMRLGQMDDLGDPLAIDAINRQRGIVGGLEQAGSQAAELGLKAGAMARTAEQRLADLTAAGVQPLNAPGLAGSLRRMAAAERANPEKASVLTGFADQLEDLARANGGVIDARDLYELRKDAGGIVERLLQGRTPDAIRKRTAEVVGAVRPLIDDAIEAAGGVRWREYLDTFSTGMDEARRVELTDFARKLAVDQPEQFQRLMRGDRPDIVERYFGKGRYDINETMKPRSVELPGPVRPGFSQPSTAPAGPSRFPTMQGVANELGVDTFIKNSMTPGAQARAQTLMQPPVNFIAEASRSLPFNVGYPVSSASDIFENRFVAPRVVKALEGGFASPQGANALLDYLPAGKRGINFLEGLSPDTLRALQQFGVQVGREPNRPRR